MVDPSSNFQPSFRNLLLSELQVSVHVGLANNDWIQMQSWDVKKISPYTATGPGLPGEQGVSGGLFVGWMLIL